MNGIPETAAAIMAADQREIAMQAEQVLIDIARENRPATWAESQYFRQATGWDDRQIAHQLGRAARIVADQAIAGTATEREALDKAVADAAKAIETQGAKLAAKIAQMQTELNGLYSDHARLCKRADEAAAAVQRIRSNAPDFAKADAEARDAYIGRTFRAPVANLQTEIDYLRRLMAGPPSGDDQARRFWFDALQREAPGAVAIRDYSFHLTPDYEAHKARWVADISRLERELADLRAAQAEAVEAIHGDPLSYHVL